MERYDPDVHRNMFEGMSVFPDGKWVLYTDHLQALTAVEKKCDRLSRREAELQDDVQSLRETCTHIGQKRRQAEQERDALKDKRDIAEKAAVELSLKLGTAQADLTRLREVIELLHAALTPSVSEMDLFAARKLISETLSATRPPATKEEGGSTWLT